VFTLVPKSSCEGEHTIFGILGQDNLTQDDVLQSHPFLLAYDKISFFFMAE
jgi:hypothetical protein